MQRARPAEQLAGRAKLQPQLQAVSAVCAVLLVAYTNRSLTGLLFWGAFAAWGAVCVVQVDRARALRASAALWSAAAALAGCLLAIEIILQLAYSFGRDSWARDADISELLELLGLLRASNSMQLALAILPPALVVVAASMEAQAARAQLAVQRLGAAHEELLQVGHQQRAPAAEPGRAVGTTAWAPEYSNAGVLTAASLALASLAWPAMLSVPYLAVVMYKLWWWGGAKSAGRPSCSGLRCLQGWTGLHIVALYLWQITMLRATALQPLADWLGLFDMVASSPAFILGPQVTALVALHVLYVSLGLYIGKASSAAGAALEPCSGTLHQAWTGLVRQLTPVSWRPRRATAEDDGESEDVGLISGALGHRNRQNDSAGSVEMASPRVFPQPLATPFGLASAQAHSDNVQPQNQAQQSAAAYMRMPDSTNDFVGSAGGLPDAEPVDAVSKLPSLAALLLPFLAEVMMQGLERLSAHLPFVAVLQCVFGLLEPSIFSAGLLFSGMWLLLAPEQLSKRPYTAVSSTVSTAVSVWLGAAYIATALAATHAAVAPAWLQSLGLFVHGHHSVPSLFPLASHFVLAACIAGNVRSTRVSACQRRSLQRLYSPLHGRSPLSGRGRYSRRNSLAGRSPVGLRHGQPDQPDAGLPQGSDGKRTAMVVEVVPEDIPMSPVSEGGRSRLSGVASTMGSEAEEAGSWAALAMGAARVLWYTGFLLTPCAALAVGLAQTDLLHAVYLLGMLAYFLLSTCQLEPAAVQAVVAPSQHALLRTWASLHLAAMYVVLVSGMPGMGSALQPPNAQAALEAWGLWHPRIVKSLAPVLGVLLLATLHAAVGRWLKRHEHVVEGHPAAVLLSAKVAVSFGALLIALLGYVLLLLACPVSLLGLGYLFILIVVFVYPPLRGVYRELDEWGRQLQANVSALPAIAHARLVHLGEHRVIVMIGGSMLRWVPLALLSVYAAIDWLLQYALAATSLPALLHLSDSQLTFMENVVGFSVSATGWELTRRLLRPAVLLGALHLQRFGFALGTLQAQHEQEGLDPAEAARRRRVRQLGLQALAKRALVLHASKLVALALFAAAMALPGGIGDLLVFGLAVLAPLLGGPGGVGAGRSAVMLAVLAVLDCITAVWLAALYAFQVSWLRQLLTNHSATVAQLVDWAGLRLAQPPGPSGLESLLRAQALVLLAVALKRRSYRWLQQLPRPLRDAGGPGGACALFWPPPGTPGHPDDVNMGLLTYLRNSPMMLQLRFAVRDVKRRLRTAFSQALQAVDWPQESGSDSGRKGFKAKHGRGERSSRPSARWWTRQMSLLGLLVQDGIERFWQDGGLELAMLTLLLAACSAANLLSLLYLLAIGAGMALPGSARRAVWRMLVLPLLASLLVMQYSVLVGLPPSLQTGLLLSASKADTTISQLDTGQAGDAVGLGLPPDLKDWMGLDHVSRTGLWFLFLSFAFTVMRVHYESWQHATDHAASEADYEPTFWEMRQPSFYVAPVLTSTGSVAQVADTGHLVDTSVGNGGVPPFNTVSTNRAQASATAPVGGVPAHGLCTVSRPRRAVLAPMQYDAQPQWTWLEWARFYLYRYYTDVVLVAVVALCTAENDLIHAGYLALALLLFRYRAELRTRRNSLFSWLPAYNLAVLAITLAYQAPFSDIFGGGGVSAVRQTCNVAHLVGLYKMARATSWARRGAAADVALWVILRLQTRVFASRGFDKAMAVEEDEAAAQARSRAVQHRRWVGSQAGKALGAFRLRAARALRVARLKAGVLREGAAWSLDAALLEDNEEAADMEQGRNGTLLEDLDNGPDRSHSRLLRDSSQAASGDEALDAHTPHGLRVVRSRPLLDAERSDAINAAKGRSARVRRASTGDASPLAGQLDLQRAGSSDLPPRPSSAAPGGRAQHMRVASATAVQGNEGTAPHDLPPSWWTRVKARVSRLAEGEAGLCYALMVVLYIADFSVAALVLQLALFGYALLAPSPHARYWQVVLVYTEALLVAQYLYQIPTRLACQFVPPRLQAAAAQVGLHGSATRALPLFAVYLAVLMHTYTVTRREGAPGSVHGSTAQRSSTQGLQDLETGRIEQPSSLAQAEEDHTSDAFGQFIRRWARRLLNLALGAGLAIYEFAARTCTASERPLHFIKVQLVASTEERTYWRSAAGRAHLQRAHQSILDRHRATDITAARLHRAPPAEQVLEGDGDEAGLFATVPQAPGSLPGSPPGHHALRTGTHAIEETLAQTTPQRPNLEGASTWTAWPDLSTIGPLQLVLQRVLDDGKMEGTVSVLFEVIPLRSTPDNSPGWCSIPGWPLRSLRPAMHAAQTLLRHRAEQEHVGSPPPSRPMSPRHLPWPGGMGGGSQAVAGAAGVAEGSGAAGQQAAQLHGSPPVPMGSSSDVLPPPASGSAPPGLSRLRPPEPTSSVAAEVLADTADMLEAAGSAPAQRDLGGVDDGGGVGGRSAAWRGLRIRSVERHSRAEQDWYAATIAVDLLTFLYVALFYQAVVTSARSLADISYERVVPTDYLGVLLLLFSFLVLDRLAYTLGAHAGKAALLLVQMTLFYWYTWGLFWSPLSSTTARWHLRIIMALKSASFALSALQLRSGYPPPASYRDGRGRHAFVFMRRLTWYYWLSFQIFAAVPFLYELRALLDWSCTPTTLKLFDWLKLEDIYTSLYNVANTEKARRMRRLGQRTPRYLKFFQGTLLFAGLLLLLWVPLLVFSSGNPTYQVPGVTSFAVNATLGAAQQPSQDMVATLSFPLYSAGERRALVPWLANGSLPADLASVYTPDQLRLLCVSPDSDRLWTLSPPAREVMAQVLRTHSPALSLAWSVLRDGPPASVHGGPLCSGTHTVPLAGETRMQLLELLEGNRTRASLMVLNATDVNGTYPGHGGSRALYPLFWQLRGDACSVRPTAFADQAQAAGNGTAWARLAVACNATLAGERGREAWWALRCGLLDASGHTVNASSNGWSACDADNQGPRVVAVLERVQGGLLGQTLSSFGITGLYVTFVFGIGRFLRLSMGNLRARIPYEDLPEVSRLMTLCQDIYIARAEGELELEEELYWVLINIYRNPLALIEITKRKQE